MKKVILLIAVFVVSGMAISCKKSYSCACRTIFTVSGSDPETLTRVEPLTEKMTKKQAKAACAQAEKQMSDNNTIINYGLSSPSSGVEVTVLSTCSLQ